METITMQVQVPQKADGTSKEPQTVTFLHPKPVAMAPMRGKVGVVTTTASVVGSHPQVGLGIGKNLTIQFVSPCRGHGVIHAIRYVLRVFLWWIAIECQNAVQLQCNAAFELISSTNIQLFMSIV